MSKSYTLEVQEKDGEFFIEFPDEVMKKLAGKLAMILFGQIMVTVAGLCQNLIRFG